MRKSIGGAILHLAKYDWLKAK